MAPRTTPKAAAKRAPAARHPAKRPRPVRTDVYLPNETTAIVIADASMVGAEIEVGGRAWGRAVADGRLCPIELRGDLSAQVRVVIGPLTEEEEEAWVGELRRPLQIIDGLRLLGGVELISEPEDSEVAALLRRFCREVPEVPAGRYELRVLEYLWGPNGELHWERASDDEPIGAYFRRTRPRKKTMPDWLADWLRRDPRLDPGHELAWDDADPVEVEHRHIDYVLQLIPTSGQVAGTARPRSGFLSFGAWRVRKPATCPLGDGLRSDADPDDNHDDATLVTAPPVPFDEVQPRVAGLALTPLTGGEVAWPVARVQDAARIATWIATGQQVGWSITGAPGFAIDGVEGLRAVSRDGRIDVEIRADFRGWARLVAAERCAAALAGLPDGAQLELHACPEEANEHAAGPLRLRGNVRSGTWHIADTHPPLPRGLLADALALARDVDGGEAIRLARGEAAWARTYLEALQIMPEGAWQVTSSRIRLAEPDARTLHFVAEQLFRRRVAGRWLSEPPDEDDDDEDDDDDELLTAGRRLEEGAQQAALTTGGELVLQSTTGTYRRVDLARARPVDAEHIAYIDRQMAALKLAPFLDVVHDRFGDVIVRLYGAPGATHYGAHLCGLMQSLVEFVTQVGDAELVTTSAGQSGEDPARHRFVQACPGLKPRQQYEQHVKRVAELARTYGAPQLHAPDPVRACEMIDRSMKRQER